MPYPLLLRAILQRARTTFADAEVATRSASGIHRYTNAALYERVCRLANVLKSMGVGPGDRVGTLAWNHYRHLELYYAAPCSGAVLHTANFRLFPDQLAYIVNHAADKVL
ncbi:MAG: AMP-binding protein, partial [Chloroflexota bacterium]